MESKDDLVSQLADAEYEWVNAIVYWKTKEIKIWQDCCLVLNEKIKMENYNLSRSEKIRLGKKLNCAFKELEKARESGDLSAIVAAKAHFREVQEEIRKSYGE